MSDEVLVNVSQELNEHFQAIKTARDAILENSEASGQEKSSIINSTTTAIKELSRIQTELYNSGTIAKIQQAVVNVLGETGLGLKEEFLERLGNKLEEI